MLTTLDHVVLAVRDLGAAGDTARRLLGSEPSWHGRHPGQGTANALFRLENTYLELLARDGEGLIGDAVAEADEGLLALAFGTGDVDAFAEGLRERGLEPSAPMDGEGTESRTGAVRRWRSVFVPAAASRGVPLFAIQHASPDETLPHAVPCAEAPVVALDHVVVLSPDLDAARALYGDTLGLRLALDRTFEKRGQRILFFRVGGATVEVVGSSDPEARDDGPDRLWGLAWRVDDVPVARARLTEAGFDVSDLRPGAKPGTSVCTVRGEPLGVPTLVIGPQA